MNITVIGIGKLGLGFALLLEKHGYIVMGIDINEEYVSSINSKTITFHEPGYNELLKESKNFYASTNLEEGLRFSDIIFILVQTPNGGGERFYDHSILSNLLMKINKLDYFNKDIIIGCTVMPGYIDQIAKTLLPDSFISYNPEFVAQGDIIYGFENSDIILVGTEHEHLCVLLESIYSFNKKGTFCHMTPLEAEIVKISLNGYITTKISYANMISDLCDNLGANKNVVLDAIGCDSRIGKKYFKPGYSFGGPCFPRDTLALKQLLDQNSIQSSIIKATSDYNGFHIDFQVKELLKMGKSEYIFENVSYKESSIPLIEESAKLKIAKRLAKLGIKVIIHESQEMIEQVKKEYGNLFQYIPCCNLNEKVINYWNSRPCNIKHSDKPIGTREYFMEVTKRKYFVEPHIRTFVNFNKYRGKKVLEVGCGIGTAAQTFSEHDAFYTGIDISENSIKIARQRFDVMGLNGILFVHDIQKPLVMKNYYDLIYSFGVLHHIPDIKLALDNIYNALKQGGEFKLMLYAKNSYKYKQIVSGKDQFEAQSGVPVANVYTNNEVYELLGYLFMDVQIWQTHIFPYKVEEYLKYNYIIDEPFSSMTKEQFNEMESELGWHLCITCRKGIY
jgi:UDPglucose 6-dehydrogenase